VQGVLDRISPNDVDIIVIALSQKTIHRKDPRYASASLLAESLESWLIIDSNSSWFEGPVNRFGLYSPQFSAGKPRINGLRKWK
jgi:hypothetical protein